MKSKAPLSTAMSYPNEIAEYDIMALQNERLPPSNFIVSRFKDGSVASYYSDDYWDWSPYHPRSRSTRFSFIKWCGPAPTPVQRTLISEIQFLAYSLIWHRDGMPLSHGSMQHYIGALNQMAEYCEESNVSVEQLLNSSDLLIRFYNKLSGVRCKYMAALLGHLITVGSEKTGLTIARGSSWKHLQRRIVEQRSLIEQHPPIPTKILSTLLSNLKKELEDFEIVADRLLDLFKTCAEDASLGRVKKTGSSGISTSSILTSPERSFYNLLDDGKLIPYFSAKGLPIRIHSLPRAIKEIQLVAGLLIKAYSGMRHSECMFLPYDCLEISVHDGNSHYLLKGTSSKLNHGNPRPAKWVTSAECRLAVQLCQKIALCIYSVSNGPSLAELTSLRTYPLFVAASYAQLGRSPKPRTIDDAFVPSVLGLIGYPILLARIVPVICEQDLAELTRIDPHRNWSASGEYGIGKIWPLTSHQLRRSLALYASRSGLVSLPTLRRQLQHITEEMSRYYARGSQAAADLIGSDKSHFGVEYQETQFESQALAYIENVLLSDEKLFGAHGVWADRHIRESAVHSLTGRAETLKRFRKGELAYRETPFGGCTKVGPCDRRVFEWTTACINCKHSVGKPSKLRAMIKAQETLVRAVKPDTLEWTIESNELIALKELKLRVEGNP